MSKGSCGLALGLALALAAAHSETPKELSEGDLLKSLDQISIDPNNTRPLAAPEERPAKEDKTAGQTEITADNAEFNNKTHIAVFNGEVVVKNPEFNVTCDKLTAYLKHNEQPAAPDKAKTAASPKPAAGAPATKAGKGGGLEKAIAEMTKGGKVIITQDKKEADGSVTNSIGRGDKAVYNAVIGDITLTGSPEIMQGISKVVPVEEGVTLILNRDGKYRAIGRTMTLLQDSEKPAR